MIGGVDLLEMCSVAHKKTASTPTEHPHGSLQKLLNLIDFSHAHASLYQ